ncbi:MAG: hypothetical protein N2201_01530 [candidate division WOR-3 bacterium]|nr:hypothetical protein [candidate division WOR-3 bacterium]
MNRTEQLQKLEEILRKKSVRLIYDVIKSEGGLCRVKNQYYLIVNRNLTLEQKIALLSKSLLILENNTKSSFSGSQ